MKKGILTAGKDTKNKLIEAAIALFSEDGLDGVGIRAIVEKAGTALSSVNYYFKSKKELYAECIRYILSEKIDLSGIFKEIENHQTNSLQDVSNLLHQTILKLFFSFLNPELPHRYGLLLIKSRLAVHPRSPSVLVAVTEPEQLKRYLRDTIPGLDNEAAYLWVISMIGQLNYYVVAKPMILLTIDQDDYDKAFIEKISSYTSKNLISNLGLPAPDV